MDMHGKKILVVGASSGIGRATAIMISKLGGKVVLNGRNRERLDETRSKMVGDGHFVMPYDLLQLDGIKQYIRSCIEVDGVKFDGLVFCAGIARECSVRITNMDMLKHMMEENICTYAALLKEFSSKRVLNSGGAIVALSSAATIHCDKALAMYASSKAGVEAFSCVAAKEFVSRKIRVNSVCPEMTDTPLTSAFFGSVSQEQMNMFYPLGPLFPEDVANVVVFLLSDLSSKVTGQRIYLSAGNDGRPIDWVI